MYTAPKKSIHLKTAFDQKNTNDPQTWVKTVAETL